MIGMPESSGQQQPHRKVASILGYQIDDLAENPGASGGCIGVGASRLEGSTWDGSVLVYDLVENPTEDHGPNPASPHLKLRSAHRTNHGVSSVTFGGGAGELLVAAEDNGDIQLFALGKEAGTLRVITTMAEHEDVVSCVRVDTTSLLLASASYDGGIRVWNLGQPRVSTQEMSGHVDHVNALTWSPHAESLLVSVSKDCTLQLWDRRVKGVKGGQLVRRLPHAGTAVSWAKDTEHLLAVGLDDGSLELYDIRQSSRPLVMSQKVHAASIFSLSFCGASQDGSITLASGGDDATVVISSCFPGSNTPLMTSHSRAVSHGDYVRGLAWIATPAPTSNKFLLSGGWDSAIVCHAYTQ